MVVLMQQLLLTKPLLLLLLTLAAVQQMCEMPVPRPPTARRQHLEGVDCTLLLP
jgi:hypothetical protein